MVPLRVALLALLTMSLSLSGCLVGEDDPGTQESDGTSSSTPSATSASNTTTAPPSGNQTAPAITDVQANATGLNLTLTVTATGSNLTLAVAFGDNATGNGTFTSGANGTARATLNHTYAAAGAYNVTVTVSDGANAANRTLSIVAGNVTASTPMAPLKLTGSCTTGTAQTKLHPFDVTPGQAFIHGALSPGLTGVDLDWYLLDPSGKQADGGGQFDPIDGGEADLETSAPVAGTWTFRVECFVGVAASYTIDAKFA